MQTPPASKRAGSAVLETSHYSGNARRNKCGNDIHRERKVS